MYMVRILILILSFTAFLYSKSCKLDYSIMYLLILNEKSLHRPVGYPYLISFNKKSDIKKVSKRYQNLFMDSRTIDCLNVDMCVSILNYLYDKKIKNVDLGTFQINNFWFKFNDKKNYFIIEKSYEKSCEIASKYINPNNITFEDIARYHSSTKKINKLYAQNLKRNYIKLCKQLKK